MIPTSETFKEHFRTLRGNALALSQTAPMQDDGVLHPMFEKLPPWWPHAGIMSTAVAEIIRSMTVAAGSHTPGMVITARSLKIALRSALLRLARGCNPCCRNRGRLVQGSRRPGSQGCFWTFREAAKPTRQECVQTSACLHGSGEDSEEDPFSEVFSGTVRPSGPGRGHHLNDIRNTLLQLAPTTNETWLRVVCSHQRRSCCILPLRVHCMRQRLRLKSRSVVAMYWSPDKPHGNQSCRQMCSGKTRN